MKKYEIGYSVAFAIVYGATMTANVSESRSIISIAMTGNGSLALDAEAKPVIGDEVILKVSSDATARDLSFGTGFMAPALTGAISKTKTIRFVYDGTAFIATGAAVQIN